MLRISGGTSEQRQLARQMRVQGASLKHIAAELHVSMTTAHRCVAAVSTLRQRQRKLELARQRAAELEVLLREAQNKVRALEAALVLDTNSQPTVEATLHPDPYAERDQT